jgi:uncharacterized membrane protein (DUF485 family)
VPVLSIIGMVEPFGDSICNVNPKVRPYLALAATSSWEGTKYETMADSVNQFVRALSNHPDFRVSWSNRRRVVNLSLIVCGAILCCVLLLCAAALVMNRDLQPNVTSVVTTITTSVFYAAMAIIGTYIFGASWEANNFRKSSTDLAALLNKDPPSTAK